MKIKLFVSGRIRNLAGFLILLFISTIANAQFSTLHSFTSSPDGNFPMGSLVSDGVFLYGTTSDGGTNGTGTVFKIKPDGSGYSKLHDFSVTAEGLNPCRNLIYEDTYLYGMTEQGGSSFMGVVYKIKTDGTGYAKLLDFTGINGQYPLTSLIFDGTFLYGMTQNGGTGTGSFCPTTGCGVIFKIKPDGSGYLKLLDFAGATNGRQPEGVLYSDGTFLYGTTYQGGTSDDGTIFKIKPDGTGYLKLYEFTGSPNGYHPGGGAFISDGTYLYSVAGGGMYGDGIMFRIKPDGSAFSKLFDFDRIPNGQSPISTLIKDGIFFYGMTVSGGINNMGVIYKIMPDGTGYSKLFDFSGTADGSQPFGSLYSDGTSLYGTTYYGGTSDSGAVFKFHPLGMGAAENSKAEDFTIYPNPAKDKIYITNANNNAMEVSIFDIIGKQVSDAILSKNSETEMDVNGLCEGIYFVRIKSGGGIITRKIVVQR